MAMEVGLDTGPVLIERHLSIGLLENASQLGIRLSELTAELMLEALPLIAKGNYQLQPQPAAGVCNARMINKADYQIDWQQPALQLHPWAGGCVCYWGLSVAFTQRAVGR